MYIYLYVVEVCGVETYSGRVYNITNGEDGGTQSKATMERGRRLDGRIDRAITPEAFPDISTAVEAFI